jgi:hypothetical protein
MKVEYPVLRGEILRILYAAHPDWMNLKTLQFTLDDIGYAISVENILSEIKYLAEKITDRPLVKYEEQSIPGTSKKMFIARITAHGIDLIEKRLHIPNEDQHWIKL